MPTTLFFNPYAFAKVSTEYPPTAMTANTSGGYVAAASSIYSTGFDAWNAFDKNTATRWAIGSSVLYTPATGAPNAASPTTTGLGKGEWLQITLTAAKTLTSYSLTDFFSGTPQQTPVSWVLGGTNDATPSNAGNWTVIDTQTNATWSPSAQETKTLNVSPTNSFTTYRIVVTKVVVGGDAPTFCEMRLFGY